MKAPILPNQHKDLATSHKGRRKPLTHKPPFKEYLKTFENLKQSEFEQTYVRQQILSAWGTIEEYTQKMREIARDINTTMFRQAIEFIWLNLHFIYRGERRKNLFANGPWVERAYGYFMREMVGTPLFIMTRSGTFFKIATYLDEMFPRFLDEDPFKNPEYFKFPYKYATLDYMYFVYQLPERMDLLRIAEEKKMNYNQFVDYVVNHVLSVNEETGKNAYRIKRLDAPTDSPYIWHEDFRPLRARYMKVPAKFRKKLHG